MSTSDSTYTDCSDMENVEPRRSNRQRRAPITAEDALIPLVQRRALSAVRNGKIALTSIIPVLNVFF
jgi:hypothetical protein